jgi:phage gp46-like protein
MVSQLRVRIDEGSDDQPLLIWDSVWSPWGGVADWAMATASETQNQGGLRARGALHTAVIIALFTDKRMPADHPLAYLVEGDDPRGWFGDVIDVRADLGETEMGSWLWAFERAHLNEDIRRWVEAVALDALMPLIQQQVCSKIVATAYAQFAINRVDLDVTLYGSDGTSLYNHRFDDIWQQSLTTPKPATF